MAVTTSISGAADNPPPRGTAQKRPVCSPYQTVHHGSRLAGSCPAALFAASSATRSSARAHLRSPNPSAPLEGAYDRQRRMTTGDGTEQAGRPPPSKICPAKDQATATLSRLPSAVRTGARGLRNHPLPQTGRAKARLGRARLARQATPGQRGRWRRRRGWICGPRRHPPGPPGPGRAPADRRRDRDGPVLPLLAEWFARGSTETQIRTVPTVGLPDEIRSPAKLIMHRLRAKLPALASATTPSRPAARAECDDCARPVPNPGRCPQCVDTQTGKPAPTADVKRGATLARELLKRPRLIAA